MIIMYKSSLRKCGSHGGLTKRIKLALAGD